MASDDDLRDRIEAVLDRFAEAAPLNQINVDIYAAEIHKEVLTPVLTERDQLRAQVRMLSRAQLRAYEKGHKHGVNAAKRAVKQRDDKIEQLRAELEELRAHGVARDIGEATEQALCKGPGDCGCGHDTPATPTEPRQVTQTEWLARYESHYRASRDHGVDHNNADMWASDCTTNELGPKPTEPRVWRKGDPEPAAHVRVLYDQTDTTLPYLCRVPHEPGHWQWCPAINDQVPGGVPWEVAMAVLGDAVELTEVVEDQAGGDGS